MFDVDAYVLSMLEHDDRKLLREIDRLKKGSTQTEEPTLYLTLARYENNPFLLYSCLHFARKQGISVHFSTLELEGHPANGSKAEPRA